jgi:type II secretory pathway component GspD/PulD (secretin)
LTTSGEAVSETPGLAGIPFLGRLFRKDASEASRHRLTVWLTLQKSKLR